MRSFLFVPADSERKLARGLESGADALILDLEDSVVPANRPGRARLARAFLDATGPAGFRRYVRINPLASGAALDDLAATVRRASPTASCCQNACRTMCARSTITCRRSRLPPASPLGRIRVIAIATETPAAVFALGNYAGVSPRLEGITWGAEDLAACIGGNNRRLDGDL